MHITVRGHGSGHSYRDSDTGEKLPGVTTIIGDGVPKKALMKWSAEATADYAIDNWDRLSALPPAARLKELYRARYETTEPAKTRGTKIHKIAARLLVGEEVPIPDGLEGYVRACVAFLDEFVVRPVYSEALVWSELYRYCGILDLVADLDDPQTLGIVRWLLDFKTSRSGVWGEHAAQLAGYRYADWLRDPATGEDLDDALAQIERTGVVWLKPDGSYELVPVVTDDLVFDDFLTAQKMRRFVETGRELVGEPIVAPSTSTFRLEKL